MVDLVEKLKALEICVESVGVYLTIEIDQM